jgi:glycosyltransferase involved in cell wall biosynthesis
VRSKGTDAVDAWLERRCMRSADRVVAVTAAAAKEMAERRRDPESVVLVRNGIPALPESRHIGPVPPSTERLIVYVGTLYHRRDPRPFLLGLAALRRMGRLTAVRVDFIGNCSHYDGVDLSALCNDLGIGDVVRFVPSVPHAECQDRIRAADLLLLFAQHQPVQVPQKLYEYMATGLPMIAFADAEGETAAMLREVGGHHLITDDDPEAIAHTLDVAIHEDHDAAGTDTDVLRQWSADHQMNRLVRLIETVAP